MPKDTQQQDRLKRLLDKVNSLNIGGGGWWRAPVGTSTIRVLPPVGTMEFFFVEVGQHYIGDSKDGLYCPNVCAGQPCPICEVQDELYKAGDKDTAAKFRVGRSFFINLIDRAHPDQGVLKYQCGTTIFTQLVAYINDPDYGDISDPDAGYDVKVERTGEGKNDTRYQARAVRRDTPLGEPDQAEQWLNDASDLQEYVNSRMLSYEDLAKKSGVDVYFAEDGAEEEEAPPPQPKVKAAAAVAPPRAPAPRPAAPKPAPKAVEPEEDDEDEQPPARVNKSASAAISERMKAREQSAGKLLRR